MSALNGWTSARLDDMANDVNRIKQTIEAMKSDEIRELRAELQEAKNKPRLQMTAYVVPLIAAGLPSIILLLNHA